MNKLIDRFNSFNARLLAEMTAMATCPTAEDKAVIGSSAVLGVLLGSTGVTYADEESIFDKVQSMLGTIFGKLVAISTAIAVVMLVICGIMYMISDSPQSADAAKKRAFRVLIAWILCNLIGGIVAIVAELTGNSNVNTGWENVNG